MSPVRGSAGEAAHRMVHRMARATLFPNDGFHQRISLGAQDAQEFPFCSLYLSSIPT